MLPSQALERYSPNEQYHVKQVISWADSDRSLTAWFGNAMQKEALQQVMELKKQVFQTGSAELIEQWRLLQVSDHYYYMATKSGGDQQVHDHFSHYYDYLRGR